MAVAADIAIKPHASLSYVCFTLKMGSKVFLDMAYSPLSRTLITAAADRHIRLYDPRITGNRVHLGWCAFQTSGQSLMKGVFHPMVTQEE